MGSSPNIPVVVADIGMSAFILLISGVNAVTADRRVKATSIIPVNTISFPRNSDRNILYILQLFWC